MRGPSLLERSKRLILATLKERHEGEEDVTLISQDSLLSAFDEILAVLLALGTALLFAWLPAARASALEPVSALRSE